MDKSFLKQLEVERNNIVIPRSSEISPSAVQTILDTVKTDLGLADNNQAIAAIAVLFQQGGTARSCDGNMTIKLFNKDIKLATVRKSIKNSGFNKGERKLARSMADDIQQVCLKLQLPGNLYQKIKRQNPDYKFNDEDPMWLSDFQSVE